MALAKNPFELDVHERLRLMRDGLINYLGFLISGLVGLFMVPVLLFYLGAESYGLWLAALSLPGLAGILDLGLGISVTRAIAAAADGAREKVASFVSSVGNTLLLFGLVGGVLVAALGIPMSRVLHLSAEAQALAPSVFFLAGVVFFATALLHFARSGLVGLGRFDVANGVSSIHVLVGAAGTLALLLLGQRLLAVAAWQAASSLMAAVVALALLGRIEPHFRFRLGQFERETVRARLSFSLSSQLTTAALKVIWESPPLLIGLVRGSASIVPFYVGQRFPVAISQVAWCAAEVLYPAASSEGEPQARSRTRELLQVGIRWIVVLVLPLCVGLWILAPALLQAWLGVVDMDTLLVLRLTTAAVLMDAVGVGAFYVLWGRGEARTVFQLVGALALLELPLGAWLLAEMGVAGLAVAMLVALTLGSVALLYSAARVCGVRVGELLAPVPRGLALPVAACAATTWATSRLPNLNGWAAVVSSSLAGGLAYAVSLYFAGAREEEKTLLRESVQWPATLASLAVQKLRRLLRHVGPLRSTFYLGLALRDMLRDPWREATVVDSDYHRGLDPWKYESNPLEKARHQRAAAMLDAVRGQKPFACAL
ncbi:MAG: lipopolysaccharide biosynthesis protein, partial [Candidatus Acidiferrales bacterium]